MANTKRKLSKVKRVFVLVRRGVMDATAVCVYPWEVPILEEIHGSGAETVTLDEICTIKGHVKIVKQKLKHSEVDAPSLREQYTAMTEVDAELCPSNDPEGEWERVVNTYGRHLEINTSNAQKVFGNVLQFRRAISDYAKGRTPEMFDDGSNHDDSGEEKNLADMTDVEVRARAKEMGINIVAKSREALEAEIMDKEATVE